AESMSQWRPQEGTGARALDFAILTAARSGEVLRAKWSEIDFAAKTWTVPKERMKAGREHRVPLSSEAVELLQSLPTEEGNDFVFVGGRGAGLSAATLASGPQRIRSHLTLPGLMSSFSDLCHH